MAKPPLPGHGTPEETLPHPCSQRFQEVEEAHLRHMKGLIGSYSHSVEDTHVQIGQVSPQRGEQQWGPPRAVSPLSLLCPPHPAASFAGA